MALLPHVPSTCFEKNVLKTLLLQLLGWSSKKVCQRFVWQRTACKHQLLLLAWRSLTTNDVLFVAAVPALVDISNRVSPPSHLLFWTLLKIEAYLKQFEVEHEKNESVKIYVTLRSDWIYPFLPTMNRGKSNSKIRYRKNILWSCQKKFTIPSSIHQCSLDT
jgi:hypothetical protein